MFKKFIILGLFIGFFSFSEAKFEISNDEFENVTKLSTIFIKDIDWSDSFVFIIRGHDNKLNSKCWSDFDYIFTEYGMYDYLHNNWDFDNMFLKEVSDIAISVDGKVYNNLYNNTEDFKKALKTIKQNSKVKFRIKDKEDGTNTLTLSKDEVKNILEFFKKECKLK